MLLTKDSLGSWRPYEYDIKPWILLAQLKLEREKNLLDTHNKLVDAFGKDPEGLDTIWGLQDSSDPFKKGLFELYKTTDAEMKDVSSKITNGESPLKFKGLILDIKNNYKKIKFGLATIAAKSNLESHYNSNYSKYIYSEVPLNVDYQRIANNWTPVTIDIANVRKIAKQAGMNLNGENTEQLIDPYNRTRVIVTNTKGIKQEDLEKMIQEGVFDDKFDEIRRVVGYDNIIDEGEKRRLNDNIIDAFKEGFKFNTSSKLTANGVSNGRSTGSRSKSDANKKIYRNENAADSTASQRVQTTQTHQTNLPVSNANDLASRLGPYANAANDGYQVSKTYLIKVDSNNKIIIKRIDGKKVTESDINKVKNSYAYKKISGMGFSLAEGGMVNKFGDGNPIQNSENKEKFNPNKQFLLFDNAYDFVDNMIGNGFLDYSEDPISIEDEIVGAGDWDTKRKNILADIAMYKGFLSRQEYIPKNTDEKKEYIKALNEGRIEDALKIINYLQDTKLTEAEAAAFNEKTKIYNERILQYQNDLARYNNYIKNIEDLINNSRRYKHKFFARNGMVYPRVGNNTTNRRLSGTGKKSFGWANGIVDPGKFYAILTGKAYRDSANISTIDGMEANQNDSVNYDTQVDPDNTNGYDPVGYNTVLNLRLVKMYDNTALNNYAPVRSTAFDKIKMIPQNYNGEKDNPTENKGYDKNNPLVVDTNQVGYVDKNWFWWADVPSDTVVPKDSGDDLERTESLDLHRNGLPGFLDNLTADFNIKKLIGKGTGLKIDDGDEKKFLNKDNTMVSVLRFNEILAPYVYNHMKKDFNFKVKNDILVVGGKDSENNFSFTQRELGLVLQKLLNENPLLVKYGLKTTGMKVGLDNSKSSYKKDPSINSLYKLFTEINKIKDELKKANAILLLQRVVEQNQDDLDKGMLLARSRYQDIMRYAVQTGFYEKKGGKMTFKDVGDLYSELARKGKKEYYDHTPNVGQQELTIVPADIDLQNDLNGDEADIQLRKYKNIRDLVYENLASDSALIFKGNNIRPTYYYNADSGGERYFKMSEDAKTKAQEMYSAYNIQNSEDIAIKDVSYSPETDCIIFRVLPLKYDKDNTKKDEYGRTLSFSVAIPTENITSGVPDKRSDAYNELITGLTGVSAQYKYLFDIYRNKQVDYRLHLKNPKTKDDAKEELKELKGYQIKLKELEEKMSYLTKMIILNRLPMEEGLMMKVTKETTTK